MKRRGRPPYPDLLTPREQEVLALLREGLSNEQIAQRLGVSLAGAKYHVSEILSKLGVSTREEAARSQPNPRPWWASAFTPLAPLRDRFAWLPQLAIGTATIAVAASAGLLLWGIVRTDRDEPPASGLAGRTVVAPTATFDFSSLPPLTTGEPYVTGPANCPGTFATPGEAIEACVERLGEGYIYVGECESPTPIPSSEAFDRPCSTWEDGTAPLRSYGIGNLGADGFDHLILEETEAGWQAIGRAGCSNQNQVDADQTLDARGVDVAAVRIDDCRIPPEPLDRPTLRLKTSQQVLVNNARTELGVSRGLLYPGRGVKLPIAVHNISGGTLPWTADAPSAITLVSEDGTTILASEVGGTLARTVLTGIPTDATWYGWLVFPTEKLGTYTLRYPGQPDLVLTLEPIECLVVCGNSKPE